MKQCYKPTIFLAQIDKHLLIYYTILKARLRIRPTKVSVLAPLVVLAQARLFYCVIIATSPQDCNQRSKSYLSQKNKKARKQSFQAVFSLELAIGIEPTTC